MPTRHTAAFSLMAEPAQIPPVGVVQQYTEPAYLPAWTSKHTALEKRAITAQIPSVKLPVQRPQIRL